MNRWTLVRTLAVAALGLIAGRAAPALAEGRDTIKIVGSSTVYPFSTTVAKHFGRAGRFRTPVVESTGTGGGFKVFCSGIGAQTPDINDASRPMTQSERKSCAQAGVTAVEELRIGYDGIIVGGIAAMKGVDFTLEQLWRATAKTVPVGGKWVPNPYRSWNDIDPKLPKMPIRLYGPAPNHGTCGAFVELVLEPSCSARSRPTRRLWRSSRSRTSTTIATRDAARRRRCIARDDLLGPLSAVAAALHLRQAPARRRRARHRRVRARVREHCGGRQGRLPLGPRAHPDARTRAAAADPRRGTSNGPVVAAPGAQGGPAGDTMAA
jgi:hypothetical protein